MRFFTATDRYVFRLVLVPMLGVFALAASLLMLEKMLRLMEFVSTEGGPVTIVFKMLINLIPEYAGLAIPLGVMLGILFAFRKLATTSELDVMRAVGLSYTRLLRVPYLITFAMMGLNFLTMGGRSYVLTEVEALFRDAGLTGVRVAPLASRVGATLVQGNR